MDLINLVKDAVIDASTNFREDQLTAYKNAVKTETNPNARWVLELLLKNAEIASTNKVPLCDDTGVPHVLIEVGREVNLAPGFFEDITKGIEAGLKELPARPMAVKGNSIERIEQSQGLYNQPEMLPAPPFSVTGIKGDVVKIHVLMLGGGPEIRAHTYKVFHKRDHRKVFLEVLTWLRSEIAMLGCTPCIPAIGIGRTHFEASSLMLKAMAYGNLNIQSELENCMTGKLNNTNIGSLGIGGSVTALGSFIEVGPQRASGVRVVSMRPCCCVEPRRSTVQLSKFLE
ncbi:hydro-lyase, Fe-S type, tartrate/fumarate subfamily, alpha subunit [Methanobacterium lacus]|uniref:Hydro-lyase, Fe-S type, tartrate/fumarate subfamily, alpha subunit n=1 Tax=Methanobacterium lacus (strain AL-21) TaxID=877455 RepID=F0T959_METLA|nr:fumarate hydratase [Methanobacterium lacus]ADZ08681.1 hydro-lyase, Fe-S type, tartrate/fumarate subfamily, alpha subunit [Methanobacterium lacus]